ncbi:MAG: phosphoribosylamine--glycine ligase [Methylophilales bacterium]|jgi:phosphoribosylamine---glycine ligase|nr:phosphoribosylamine--glycine ligase [Methylophilales bacterium]|tara:strand:+ start:27631 stop:28899 length:1269 start_codon:yes stop_codon:yes gene_type:complete
MNVLIIGSGGREHALAWKISQSPLVKKIYVAPGNAGTALENLVENIDITDIDLLSQFAIEKKIDLTIVGPEVPLSKGIVNKFRDNNLNIFGPTREAAQLESSKDFSKFFMKKHGIPTAEYKTFTDAKSAHNYIAKKGSPIVIKADGLAAGKGVVVAMNDEEAHNAIDLMLSDNQFGDAGARIIIEEFLQGEEVSFIVICDGESVLPLATSQDHKRLLDNDIGPNTGGMGAYSPAPIVSDVMHEKIMTQVINPTIDGMKAEGIKFTGFLYAGLMIDAEDNIKTLEFNCRMGDPETQPILFRLKSDLFKILFDAAKGDLKNNTAEWENNSSITVVMAAKNYPNEPRLNDEIHGLSSKNKDTYIFHAGTKLTNNKIVTAGGRVLGITARGQTLNEAKNQAYRLIDNIRFDGAQFRNDIGKKALNN